MSFKCETNLSKCALVAQSRILAATRRRSRLSICYATASTICYLIASLRRNRIAIYCPVRLKGVISSCHSGPSSGGQLLQVERAFGYGSGGLYRISVAVAPTYCDPGSGGPIRSAMTALTAVSGLVRCGRQLV